MKTHSFDTEIAMLYGVNAALLLQNIAFWIEKNRANGENFRDGRYWTYMSYSAFGEIFPYLGQKQIRGALNKLKDEGLIITGNYSKKGKVNVTWYALTDKGERLVYPQSAMSKGQASDNAACQNDKQLCQNGRELCQNGKPNKDIIQRYNNIYTQHDEDDCSSSPDARACACEELPEEEIVEYLEYSQTAESAASDTEPNEAKRYIKAAWKYHTGRSPNTTNIDDILCVAAINKMQMATISEAIRLAARNAGGSITDYACQCLKDWAGRGLHTISEIFEADIAQSGLLPAT